MKDELEYFITTKDNPYNYFTQFDDWYAFDEQNGYHTLEYLARIAKTSDALSDEDNEMEIDRAIEEILKYNVLGIYKKIERVNETN